MIRDIFLKRRQVKVYDDVKKPDDDLVDELLKNAYELTASKQSLMPYKIHVLNADKVEEKKIIYQLSITAGTDKNINILNCSHLLIFTPRLAKPSAWYTKTMVLCDPEKYKKEKVPQAIEIGMFAKVFTALCLEKNLGVSYIKCIPPNIDLWPTKQLPFVDEQVMLLMAIGYPKIYKKKNQEEFKPPYDMIVHWE